MKKIVLFFVVAILGFCLSSGLHSVAKAEDSHPLMSKEEQEIRQRAHQRLYPGGRDEEPLKVSPQLPVITRKMGPATEALEAEEPSETHD